MSRMPGGLAASFVLRRMGSSRLLLASILLAVLVSSGLAAALITFGLRTLPAAAQSQLASSGSSSIQISAQVTLSQEQADGRAIAALLRSALGPVPVTLDNALWSVPFKLPGRRSLHGVQVQAQAAALDGITENSVLTAGTWPAQSPAGQPIQVAVPTSTAAALGLTAGGLLTLPNSYTGAPVRMRITGLFRPRNPASRYWSLSLLGVSGSSLQNGSLTYGPLVVSRAVFSSGRLTIIQASWLAAPVVGRIPVGDYARLATTIGAIGGRLQQAGLNGTLAGAPASHTTMPQTLNDIAGSLTIARSVLLIGALQLLLIAAAAVALSAQRLTGQREEESALLSARGMTRRQLAGRATLEAVLLAVFPAAAGALAGTRLAEAVRPGARSSAPVALVIPGSVWWTAAGVMAGCVALMLWPILRPGDPGSASVRRGRQVSLAGSARAGADLALIALGALAIWQLRLFTAAPRSTTGSLGVYPVLAVAPALALAGATMVLLRLLPVMARGLDKGSARTRRLTAALASWQVSRRPVRQSGPALLVVLAVAAGTLAFAEHQSWLSSARDQANFAAGADVRTELAAPVALGRVGTIARARGVTDATPALRFEYNYGGTVLALDPRQAAGTVLLRRDLTAKPAPALWRDITPRGPAPGVALPGRPTRLQITARLGPTALARTVGPMPVRISVQDAEGIVYTVPAGSLSAGQHQLVARLSDVSEGSYPLRLVAITMSYTMPPLPKLGAIAVTLGSIADSAAGSGPFPAPFAAGRVLSSWQQAVSAPLLQQFRVNISSSQAAPPALAPAPGHPAGTTAVSFTPGFGLIPFPEPTGPQPSPAQLLFTAPIGTSPEPAIATDAFLTANHLHLGQTVAMAIGSDQVQARIVAAAREFPTISDAQGGGLILDQATVQDALVAQSAPPLPVTEWWLRTTTGGVPAGLPSGAVNTDAASLAAGLVSNPLDQAQQFALLAIALAAALLAAVGFSVSVAGSMRERRTQGALLAALGVNRAAQARQLCLEQLMLSGPAAITGLLLGVGLAWLLVPSVIITTAGLPPVPTALVQIPLAWAIGLALVVTVVPVLTAAVTLAYRPDPAAQLRTAAAT
jgi:hypothetical protein